MQTSLLLHAFARRDDTPLTFSELAAALEGTGATVSELVAALCRAQAQRTVVSCGFADAGPGRLGPRLLALSERGREAVAADRGLGAKRHHRESGRIEGWVAAHIGQQASLR